MKQTMTIDTLFGKLWNVYSELNPKVLDIRACLLRDSPSLINDHIALRTLDHPRFGIDRLASDFLALGYEVRGHYHFEGKKLDAVHLEHKTLADAPKVFISALVLGQCSDALRKTVQDYLIDKSADTMETTQVLAASGRHWGVPSYAVYQALLEESEYAAWFYVFGFTPNHFTVKINSLEPFQSIHALNDFLEEKGYTLNASGGKVKGAPELFLEQSSTMADKREIVFQEGSYEIPSVFYEFAKRYVMPDGKEFSAFIEGNADKIFESTNVR